MYILNLIDRNRSTLGYKKHTRPDGQVGITLDDKVLQLDKNVPVLIVARFNTYEDLFYVLAATDVLQHRNHNNIYLAFTYFMGQENDERGDEMNSFDLKIITDIINSKNYASVLINAPYSMVLPALLNNCRLMPENVFIQFIYTTLGIKPEDSVLIKHHLYNSEHVFGKTVILLKNICRDWQATTALAKDLKHFGAKQVVLAAIHGVHPGVTPYMKDVDMVISTNSIYDTQFPNYEKQFDLNK